MRAEGPIQTRKIDILYISIIGVFGLLLSLLLTDFYGVQSGDFTWLYRAAQLLLNGNNPYLDITPSGPYPYDAYLYYPLPTAVLAIPFTALPIQFAGPVFFGISSALLAYAISRDGWDRVAVFLSVPYFIAASVAQFGPILMAATLLSGIPGALSILKPSQGLIAFNYRPKLITILTILGILAATWWILPFWPLDWIESILAKSQGRFLSVVLRFPGPLLLLSILKWREPRGRVLLLSSLIPRNPYWYDGLLLWIVPKNRMQGIVLSLSSWVAYAMWWVIIASTPSDYVQTAWLSEISIVYLTALILLFLPELNLLLRRIIPEVRIRLGRRE